MTTPAKPDLRTVAVRNVTLLNEGFAYMCKQDFWQYGNTYFRLTREEVETLSDADFEQVVKIINPK